MLKDYFVYLPETGLAEDWGLEVTAAGFTRVLPGVPYPPGRHPSDHDFTWERGRVLHAHQLIFISEGAGTFESDATSRILRVRTGDVILLLPGVWHRYAPDPATGWVEHWVECRGPTANALRRKRMIRADRPVVTVHDVAHLHQCFETLHQWAGAYHHRRIELATLVTHMYTLVRQGSAPTAERNSRIDDVIRRAQLHIAEHAHQPLHTAALARQLGVGYSYFRRAFRGRVGVAPKRYHVHVRLRRAQELLTNTSMTITQIASAMGFDTPFHLSQQFKRYMGVSPQAWRKGAGR